MTLESGVAILIVGAYVSLYFTLKDLSGELSWLKGLGYLAGLWMAVSGLNVAIAFQTGVSATITDAIDIHYWGYTYIVVAITGISFALYLYKIFKELLVANKTKL